MDTLPVFKENSASPENGVWKAASAWNGRFGWQAKESSNFPLRFKWNLHTTQVDGEGSNIVLFKLR